MRRGLPRTSCVRMDRTFLQVYGSWIPLCRMHEPGCCSLLTVQIFFITVGVRIVAALEIITQ